MEIYVFMKNEYFWEIVKKFNNLMKTTIEGPNCTDPTICHGDCCSIQIDVPKILAKEYINQKIAQKEDFIRSDIFSFKLRFDENTRKCFLFDKNINGCSVHKMGIKPPQCWIYPTKFLIQDGKVVKCKRSDGWRIKNTEKAKQAGAVLQKYNFLCQLEAKKELDLIKDRIRNSNNKEFQEKNLIKKIQNISPKELAGFKDSWKSILPLSAEGVSLQIKKFCTKYNRVCELIPDNFLECNQICKIIAHKLLDFLENNLYIYIKKKGPDSDGQYPFYLLFNELDL